MNIVVSNTANEPIYQQIFKQISAQIMKGELESDFCLPSIRTVAKELRISVITVKKAWEDLEQAGFIYTMSGKGCFIAPMSAQALDTRRNELVSKKLMKDMEYYKSLGLSKAEVVALVEQYYDA